MSPPRLRVGLSITTFLIVASPVHPSVRDFSAEISLGLPAATSVTIGSTAGQAQLSNGVLQLPALALTDPVATTFTPPGSLCASMISVVPSGFLGGTLSAPAASKGFGGAIGIDGNVVLEVLAGAVPGLPNLGVPLRMGSFASPVSAAFTTSPAISAPPAQALLSLSYSRWTTAQVKLTGTHGGAITGLHQTTGSLLSTVSGGQVITLVSPIHIHYSAIDDTGLTKTRTVALSGRMLIIVPSPSTAVGQLAGVATLIALGLHRRRIRRSFPNREGDR